MITAVAERRLEELRAAGAAAVAPLWNEVLPPEETLAEARRRSGPVFRLQEAHVLLELGRDEEAREVLGALGELPEGLRSLREELLGRLTPDAPAPAPGPEPRGLASKTLAELYARQGDAAAAAQVYGDLLIRDPNDRPSRERRDELLGRRQPSGAAALAQWLGRVRAWREVLGV